MFRVVICPDCKDNAWIVKGTPDRTSCTKCGHTRKLQRLKQVHKTEDSDEAKLAVAQAKAKVNDRMDEFKDAYEQGFLTGDPDFVFEDLTDRVDDALQEELKAVDDRMKASSSSSRSHKQIIRDGVSEQDAPSKQEVIDYAEEYGVDPEKTSRVLRKLRDQGRVIKTADGLEFV